VGARERDGRRSRRRSCCAVSSARLELRGCQWAVRDLGVDGSENKGRAARLWLQSVTSRSCGNTRPGTRDLHGSVVPVARVRVYVRVRVRVWLQIPRVYPCSSLVLRHLARRGFVWEHRERQMIGVDDEIPRCIVVGWVHVGLAESSSK